MREFASKIRNVSTLKIHEAQVQVHYLIKNSNSLNTMHKSFMHFKQLPFEQVDKQLSK